MCRQLYLHLNLVFKSRSWDTTRLTDCHYSLCCFCYKSLLLSQERRQRQVWVRKFRVLQFKTIRGFCCISGCIFGCISGWLLIWQTAITPTLCCFCYKSFLFSQEWRQSQILLFRLIFYCLINSIPTCTGLSLYIMWQQPLGIVLCKIWQWCFCSFLCFYPFLAEYTSCHHRIILNIKINKKMMIKTGKFR